MRCYSRYFIGFFFLVIICAVLNIFNSTRESSHEFISWPLDRAGDGDIADTSLSHKFTHGLNVHVWHGICSRTIQVLCNYPLFPKAPVLREIVNRIEISRNSKDFGQRLFGYLNIPVTGNYRFAVSSDDSSEFWLSSDSNWQNSKLVARVGEKNTILSTDKERYLQYSTQVSNEIHLRGGKKYFIEIVHVEAGGANHLSLVWKRSQNKSFEILGGEFLSPYLNETAMKAKIVYDTNIPGSISCRKVENSQKEKSFSKTKDGGHHMGYIQHKEVQNALPSCMYSPSQHGNGKTLKKYDAIYVNNVQQRTLVDPWYDASGIMEPNPNRTLLLPAREKRDIVDSYMNKINLHYPGQYDLVSVEGVQCKLDKLGGKRYLLELNLQRRSDGKLLQLSQYIFKTKSNGSLCYPIGVQWNRTVDVHFIVTSKNQGPWVQHLINNLAQIYRETNDPGINVIVTDYNSPDINLEAALQRSGLARYTVIRMNTREFIKTEAYNKAASSVRDPHSIIFLLDLHLDMTSSSIVHNIRKYTVEGKMVYTPVLARLHCGASIHDPRGWWENSGFGLIGIYKSDWDRIGGYAARRRGWGGEDWDIMDQIVQHNLEFERMREPIFHYYHTKKGMWH